MQFPTPPSNIFTIPFGATSGARITLDGTRGAIFVYDNSNNLICSITPPGVTSDGLGHNNVVPDAVATYNSFGAVINVLSMAKSAFFQYQDNGTAVQGNYILAVASTSGTDPVGGLTYQPGLNGINPVFANFMVAVGSSISFGVGTLFSSDAAISTFGQGTDIGPRFQAESGIGTGTPAPAGQSALRMYGDNTTGTPKASMRVFRDDGSGNAQALTAFGVAGPVQAIIPGSAAPGTLETWHAASLVTGWTGSFNYRLTERNTVLIDYNITFTDNGTTHLANNTGVCILPAAYSPLAGTTKKTTPQLAGTGNVLAANRTPDMQIGSNGSVFVFNVTTSALNNTAIFTGTWEYPLDI